MSPLLFVQPVPWTTLFASVEPAADGAGAGSGPDLAVVVFVLLAGWAAGMVASVLVRTLARVLPLERPSAQPHGVPAVPLRQVANLAGFAAFWIVLSAAALFALQRMDVERHFVLFAGLVLLALAGFALVSAWRLGLMDTAQLLLAEYLQSLDDKHRDKLP